MLKICTITVCKLLTRSSAIAKRTARPWYKIIKNNAINGHMHDFGTNLKLVVNFLYVIIKHFQLSLTVEALGANTAKSVFVVGWVTLRLNIRLKGYAYLKHLYIVKQGNGSTITLLIEVYAQKNFVAELFDLYLDICLIC